MRLTTFAARRRLAAAVAAGALLLSGCRDFLTNDKSVNDPNNPTLASRNQLLVGAGANLMGIEESDVAMIICQWVQQCAGVAGRFVQSQAEYTGVNSGTFRTAFASFYAGGGLIQLRQIEALSDSSNDKVGTGIAEVMEAMVVGTAADIWGDIPYREATTADKLNPAFDPQMQIYDDLQTLLDKAITDLNGTGEGPGAFDLFYAGDKAKWIELANTVKARLYLHTVEKLGTEQYAKALAAAQLGISTPDNDFKDPHTSATSERNVWAQFQVSSFGQDLVAGKPLVDIMLAQNDPRIPEYFGKNPAGGYGGFDQVTGSTPPTEISPIAGSGRTSNDAFSQPIVTFDENQLILAEANFVLNGPAAAAPFLNAVRAEYGKPEIASPTLNDIMSEKYIALFQNIEYWNDYKRTCLPALSPAAGKAAIPGRLFYSDTETQTNTNTPDDSNLSLFTMRNANDPNSCQ